jgi:hypothetical protein
MGGATVVFGGHCPPIHERWEGQGVYKKNYVLKYYCHLMHPIFELCLQWTLKFFQELCFENFPCLAVHLASRAYHVQRVSAKHGVKDDFVFLWEHAIFRHPPNKNPLTDRSEILHS